jgi:hypothetical protein
LKTSRVSRSGAPWQPATRPNKGPGVYASARAVDTFPALCLVVLLPRFRRLTTAYEKLATYIDGWESNRPSTTPSLARMECEARP